MYNLTEEVDVTNTTAPKTVQVQNMGVQLIIAPNVMCGGRTVSVPISTGTDPAANVLPYIQGAPAAIQKATPEYLKAVAAFTQSTCPNGAPSSIKLGAMGGAASATVTIVDNAGAFNTTGDVISANLNGVTVTTNWLTDKNTTLTAFAAALQVALRAQTSGDTSSTVTYTSGTHTILITPKTGVSVFIGITISQGATDALAISSITYSSAEAYADAFNRIQIADDNFYQVTIASILTADILAVGAAVKAMTSPKVFFFHTNDANVLNLTPAADAALAASGTVVAQIKGTARCFGLVNLNGQHIENSFSGFFGSYAPGMINPAYIQLDPSITPDTLTATQEQNSRGYYSLVNGVKTFTAAKECNTLETVAGFNIIRWGRCADGTWLDRLVFQDYLNGALQAAVYGVLINNPKAPMDVNGFAMIKGAMDAVFKPMVSLPGVPRQITQYAEDSSGKQAGGYYITFPSLLDPSSANGYVSAADRLARVLNNLKWGCWYTDGINSVHMIGTIS